MRQSHHRIIIVAYCTRTILQYYYCTAVVAEQTSILAYTTLLQNYNFLACCDNHVHSIITVAFCTRAALLLQQYYCSCTTNVKATYTTLPRHLPSLLSCRLLVLLLVDQGVRGLLCKTRAAALRNSRRTRGDFLEYWPFYAPYLFLKKFVVLACGYSQRPSWLAESQV